jgi:exodeoxyribonuclease VII small subunit
MAKKVSYTDAYVELQSILSDLQDESITIDLLPLKLERAQQLIQICEAKLFETEEKYQAIIDNLNKK